MVPATATLRRLAGESSAYRLAAMTNLRPEMVERFDRYQRDVFGRVADEAPLRQFLNERELTALVESPSTEFVFILDEADSIVAHLVACWDLEVLDWYEPRFFAARYPEQYQEGRICTVASIGAAENAPVRVAMTALIDHTVRRVAECGGVALADVRSGGSVDSLGPFIAMRCAMWSHDVTWRRPVGQQFYAFEVAGPRSEPLSHRASRARIDAVSTPGWI